MPIKTREVNFLKIDTSNSKALLHSVIEQAVQKVEELKRLNAQVHDVGRENVIVEYLKILIDALKTRMAMESPMKEVAAHAKKRN